MPASKLRTIILVSYLVIIAVIPTAAFVLSKTFNTSSSASNRAPSIKKQITTKLEASGSSILDEEGVAGEDLSAAPSPQGSASPSASPTSESDLLVSGPTMSFSITSQGRPVGGDQSNQVFVGVYEGSQSGSTALTTGGSPTYLVSSTVSVPASGVYQNFSLAGLSIGKTYTVFLKGQAQIATSSAFLMRPGNSALNNGFALYLTTGDVNDDNTINQADYNILTAYFGVTRASSNWNPILDFNNDGIINGFELGMVSKNMAKTGTSGTFVTSTP